MTGRQIVMRLFIILVILMLCGCAHIRYGPVEYWRLGKQEVSYLYISEPNGLTLVLCGHKGGENVKPSLADLIGSEE